MCCAFFTVCFYSSLWYTLIVSFDTDQPRELYLGTFLSRTRSFFSLSFLWLILSHGFGAVVLALAVFRCALFCPGFINFRVLYNVKIISASTSFFYFIQMFTRASHGALVGFCLRYTSALFASPAVLTIYCLNTACLWCVSSISKRPSNTSSQQTFFYKGEKKARVINMLYLIVSPTGFIWSFANISFGINKISSATYNL